MNIQGPNQLPVLKETIKAFQQKVNYLSSSFRYGLQSLTPQELTLEGKMPLEINLLSENIKKTHKN